MCDDRLNCFKCGGNTILFVRRVSEKLKPGRHFHKAASQVVTSSVITCLDCGSVELLADVEQAISEGTRSERTPDKK